MSAAEPIIVPAWLGPARPFVLSRGKALVFGAFMITDHEEDTVDSRFRGKGRPCH